MKKAVLIVPFILIVVGALMFAERPAYAYADPGTGLLAIQAVGSALVATGWYLRRKLYRLLHWGAPIKQLQESPTGKEDENSSLQ